MTEPATHLAISRHLCGEPLTMSEGHASTRFVATEDMKVDARGLVHGGFVFGLVDYAAMLAVNDPNVVLGAADVRFTAPVKVGDAVVATATVRETKGKKRVIEVRATAEDREVLTGTMTAFALDDHVLST